MVNDQAFVAALRYFETGGAVSAAQALACEQIERALRRAALNLTSMRRRARRQGEAVTTAADADRVLPLLSGGGIVEDKIMELLYKDGARRAAFAHKVLQQIRRGPAGAGSAKEALAAVARYTVRQWNDRIDSTTQVRNSIRTALRDAVDDGTIEGLSVITMRRGGDLDTAVERRLLEPPIATMVSRRTVIVITPKEKNKGGSAYGFLRVDRYLGPPGMRARVTAAKDPLAALRTAACSYSAVVSVVSRLEPAVLRFAPLAKGGTAVPQIVRRSIALRAALVLHELGAPVERKTFLRALQQLISYPGLRGTITAQQSFMGSDASSANGPETEDLLVDFLDAVDDRRSRSRSGSTC